jgi:hypothetical protein
VLLEALWAYRVSQHGAITVTPFELVYGQEAVLPVELNLHMPQIMYQDALSIEEYQSMMLDRIDEVIESRFDALRVIEKEKMKVAKAYNRRIKAKSFHIGYKVWETILTLGARDRKFEKWSPSWEGPFRDVRIVPGNSYFVETLDGRELPKALNGKYLKEYHLSIWQEV